jgi:hypothetical protein
MKDMKKVQKEPKASIGMEEKQEPEYGILHFS